MNPIDAYKAMNRVAEEYKADLNPIVVERRARYYAARHYWMAWYIPGVALILLGVLIVLGLYGDALTARDIRTAAPFVPSVNTECVDGLNGVTWCVPAGTPFTKYPYGLDGANVP